jgi:hypothetical protein
MCEKKTLRPFEVDIDVGSRGYKRDYFACVQQLLLAIVQVLAQHLRRQAARIESQPYGKRVFLPLEGC